MPRAAAFVRFYEHGEFGGQSFDSFLSRTSMPAGWNDRVSSMMLIP